ncbi:MAG: YDG/SRA domain-containing protein [Dehalococcoidales bacterium]|nr:YDG/SRA domain-containing protein [Dehalococcoidales bacterium]
MIEFGNIISYSEMCKEEDANLQRGMYFRLHNKYSVLLMSLRKNAPYADRIEENGQILIYEGHDNPKSQGESNKENTNQSLYNPSGSLNQNGLFYTSALKYKNDQEQAEIIKVYEKLRPGIWVYNGFYKLEDAWQEISDSRTVFKFKLLLLNNSEDIKIQNRQIDHTRIIPTSVKLEVWKRDKGQCIICKSKDNLHFDHIIPYSKGGSSLVASNIQLLCARHNLTKRDNIE